MITMKESMRNNNLVACPVCGSRNLLPLFSKESMPIYNLERHSDRNSALNAQTGKVAFNFCQDCLFTFNMAFNELEMDYSVDYESSRSHSKYFDNYLDEVGRDLDSVFNISNKIVVEVGCGDGQFLRKLRGNYQFKGYGFDPSLAISKIEQARDLEFIKGYYSYGSLNIYPDVIILRHILEHQNNPHSFFDKIIPKTERNNEVSIYIETPAWEWIIDHNGVLAFCYDHCSYYSEFSMKKALSLHSCNSKKVSFSFANEYIQYYGVNYGLLSKPGSAESDDAPRQSVIQRSLSFARRIPHILDGLKMYLEGLLGEAVLWGAAGKGTTLLNILDIGYEQLACAVDSNPRRHDTYVPHTGQRVVKPESLKELQPKYILITNSNYQTEISSQVEALGLHAELVPIDEIINRF